MKEKQSSNDQEYAVGLWKVTAKKNEKSSTFDPRNRLLVKLKYKNKTVMSGHGQVAYDNACQMSLHFYNRGYEPKQPPQKCLADLPSDNARRKACLPKTGQKK